MAAKLRVTVWNEGRHEKKSEQIAKVYPDGIHGAIAAYLQGCGDFEVRTATLDEPDHGLGGDVLPATDVLIWWGHMAHHEVQDAIVDKVVGRVLDGMGLVVLHSGHFSKPFRRLMGTSCNLKWREAGEKERLWVVEPGHPIVQGLGEYIEIPHEEMYGERFDIPAPDALVLVSWFAGGEVFRSGCCFRRNKGKIFYFRPGHESYPTYYHQGVLKILANAVRWAAPVPGPDVFFGNFKPLEKLETT
ncbi:MAG TPA: ThuA domain-containing protein [Planctomycetota bacterium]|nr:ThuA domain-containing protein [Planctomycetota bacterium]